MSITEPLYYKEILLRHDRPLKWKDIERLEEKDRSKVRRAVQMMAGKIALLVIPHALSREEKERVKEQEREIEEKRRQRAQAERELLLLKMKWTQDEKLLTLLPEDGFYYTLYAMYIDAPYVKPKFKKQLHDSIHRARHIGRLRSFAIDMDEIELLLECIPEDDRKKMLAAIRKNTAMMFDRPKRI